MCLYIYQHAKSHISLLAYSNSYEACMPTAHINMRGLLKALDADRLRQTETGGLAEERQR